MILDNKPPRHVTIKAGGVCRYCWFFTMDASWCGLFQKCVLPKNNKCKVVEVTYHEAEPEIPRMICQSCGGEFGSTSEKQKYCSNYCKQNISKSKFGLPGGE